MIRSVPRRIAHPGVPDRLLFVPDHALLIGGHGQLNEGSLFGRVQSAGWGLSRCAVTQDILRVIPRDGEEEVCLAYLSSSIGHRLLRSTAIGTDVPIMRLDLVSSLPYPNIPEPKRKTISSHVREAIEARRKADQMEADAVGILETEVLPAWLN